MKARIFLFTATLLMMAAIMTYEPPQVIPLEDAPEPPTEVVEVDEDFHYYNQDLFDDTCFSFVRAWSTESYVIYEVVQSTASSDWRVAADRLKDAIAEYLNGNEVQGSLLLLVLDRNNQDKVVVTL